MTRYEIAHAIWAGWTEINAICARDGVPYTRYGYKASLAESYFAEVRDNLAKAYRAVAGQDVLPWAPNAEDFA